MEIKTNDFNDAAEYTFLLHVKFNHDRYSTYDIEFKGTIVDACTITFETSPLPWSIGYEIGTDARTIDLDIAGMVT